MLVRPRPLAAIAIFAIAVIAGLTFVAREAPPTAGPSVPGTSPGANGGAPADPVSVTAQADGVVVTVALSSGRITTGDRIQVRVSVLNAGLGIVSWQAGGCELLNGYTIAGPAVPQPPAGKDWPDAVGLAKWSATTGGPALQMIRPGNVPDDMPVGCSADLGVGQIQPGETVSADAVWIARATDGTPLVPGSYAVAYAFPYLARGAALQVQDLPQPKPIRLTVPLGIEGVAFAGIPPTVAIDRALEDPRVAAWAKTHLTQQRLGGGEIYLTDAGWRFTIRLQDGGATVVLVDPASGRVLDAQLGN
jgi:hypothetical protein